MPDVVERVRRLVEGTTQSEAAIAAHVGIGIATVHGWKVRRGWTRPADASRSTRAVDVHRAGFSRRAREALRRVEALATREAQRLQHQEPPDAATLARAVTLAAMARLARQPRRRVRVPAP